MVLKKLGDDMRVCRGTGCLWIPIIRLWVHFWVGSLTLLDIWIRRDSQRHAAGLTSSKTLMWSQTECNMTFKTTWLETHTTSSLQSFPSKPLQTVAQKTLSVALIYGDICLLQAAQCMMPQREVNWMILPKVRQTFLNAPHFCTPSDYHSYQPA